MHELRQELMALRKWEAANIPCRTQIEVDAVGHRMVRMAEILRKIREMAQRN